PASGINALTIDPKVPTIVYAGTGGTGVFAIRQVSGCGGDCNANTVVTVTELITMVNIALGTSPLSVCLPADVNHDDRVTVSDIIRAVNIVLSGCPAAST